MPTNDWPRMVFDALKEHIPPGAEWVPLAAAGLTAAIGLVFMVKGARLAPYLAALVFAALGAGAGPLIAHYGGTPLWPTVAGAGAVGLVLGVLLFRVWLAVLVGTCLTLASLSIYSGQVLRNPLNEYLTAGLNSEQQLVTLPDAANAAASTDWQAKLTDLWNYLGTHVPNFQVSIVAIAISAGLAGLVFGLALPKMARAFWAASFGTALLAVAALAIMQVSWPAGKEWLSGQRGLIVAGALWLISLIYNWADVHGLRAPKPPPAEPKQATA